MGNANSLVQKDNRCEGQIIVEKNMSLQIVVPTTISSTHYVLPDFQVLAIGNFENGKFTQIANLTVSSLLQSQNSDETRPEIDIEEKTSQITMSYQTGNFKIVISDKWNSSEIYPSQLNKLIFDVTINKQRYGIKNYVYIVQKVYKCTNFLISDGTKVIRHNDPNEQKMYGYALKRYKIDRKGNFKFTKFQKVF
jgi:hypothetical protein